MMKKLLLLPFFIFLSLLLTNCKDRENDGDVMPEATQVGARTGGAIVDGKIWVASNKRVNGNLGGTYCTLFNNNAEIEIELNHVSDGSRIDIKAFIPDFEINKTYLLKSDFANSDDNFAFYLDPTGTAYGTQPSTDYIGELKISRLDIAQQIVSGTFSLKGRDINDSKTVTVTDGRFDRKFD